MAKIARTHVHVEKKGGKDDGKVVIFAAGDEIPAWAQKIISNDDVYAEDDAVVEEAPESPAAGPYDGKPDDELRALLTARELPTDGDTAALIARLTQADAEQE